MLKKEKDTLIENIEALRHLEKNAIPSGYISVALKECKMKISKRDVETILRCEKLLSKNHLSQKAVTDCFLTHAIMTDPVFDSPDFKEGDFDKKPIIKKSLIKKKK